MAFSKKSDATGGGATGQLSNEDLRGSVFAAEVLEIDQAFVTKHGATTMVKVVLAVLSGDHLGVQEPEHMFMGNVGKALSDVAPGEYAIVRMESGDMRPDGRREWYGLEFLAADEAAEYEKVLQIGEVAAPAAADVKAPF